MGRIALSLNTRKVGHSSFSVERSLLAWVRRAEAINA
jgi:hypothetical protein